jgi:L-fuconolactonase
VAVTALSRWRKASFGYADLALGDRVEPVLEALIHAGGDRLSGVRYSVGYDADPTIGNSRPDSAPHMYVRPEIRTGVARLATHGLTLDAWCYHPQLADVIALAAAVPQATVVMYHVGGVVGYGPYAGKKDEVHAAWRASMAELARCPNVSVKLGGMLNRGARGQFPRASDAAEFCGLGGGLAALCRTLYRVVRC